MRDCYDCLWIIPEDDPRLNGNDKNENDRRTLAGQILRISILNFYKDVCK